MPKNLIELESKEKRGKNKQTKPNRKTVCCYEIHLQAAILAKVLTRQDAQTLVLVSSNAKIKEKHNLKEHGSLTLCRFGNPFIFYTHSYSLFTRELELQHATVSVQTGEIYLRTKKKNGANYPNVLVLLVPVIDDDDILEFHHSAGHIMPSKREGC